MDQKIIDKCKQVQELCAQGVTLKEAFKRAHLGSASYYMWKKLGDKKTSKPIHQKFIDLKHEPSTLQASSNVILVVCQPDQIKTILKELK